jgi:hypothetical protein
VVAFFAVEVNHIAAKAVAKFEGSAFIDEGQARPFHPPLTRKKPPFAFGKAGLEGQKT